MFSENERKNSLSPQQNIGNEEVIQRIKTEAGVNDEIKTRKLTGEGLNPNKKKLESKDNWIM